eukprot:8691097-Pyramimonas_sp.AAC.1
MPRSRAAPARYPDISICRYRGGGWGRGNGVHGGRGGVARAGSVANTFARASLMVGNMALLSTTSAWKKQSPSETTSTARPPMAPTRRSSSA